MSYKKPVIKSTRFKVNNSTQGEPIELKIERMLEGKEPITNGAPLIYTERKDGINPAHDIRTNRFEVAIEATDALARTNQTRRQELAKGKPKKDGKPESTQGTKETTK